MEENNQNPEPEEEQKSNEKENSEHEEDPFANIPKTDDIVRTKSTCLNQDEDKENNNFNDLLYEDVEFNSDTHTPNVNQKSISDLYYLKDLKDFNSDEYLIRKYNKKNLDCGKLFFKYRFIRENLKNSIKLTISKRGSFNLK